MAWIIAGVGAMAVLPAGAEFVDLYTGTTNYSVPIVTPPGTNGMGPNLALSYNSGGGDGWMGAGWSLTGLGSIERRGPDYGPAPSYTSSDTFVLNMNGSKKLVYTGREPGVVGAAGNFYSTQIDTHLKIEFKDFS